MDNQMSAKTRSLYVDIAKAFAIYSVVLCHVVDNDTTIKTITMAFNMPLFFILSGFWIKNINKFESLKKYLWRKFNILIFPFMMWAIIYSKFSFANLCYILYGSHETLGMAGSLTSLWFLPVLFISIVLFCCFVFSLRKYSMKLVIPLFCVINVLCAYYLPHLKNYGYPWCFDIAFLGSIFVALGSGVKYLMESIRKLGICVIIAIETLLVLLFLLLWDIGDAPKGFVLMCEAEYGSLYTFFFLSLLGSFVILLLAIIMERFKYSHIQDCFVNIGKNTLCVFLVHKPFVFLFRGITQDLGGNYNDWLISIPISCIVLLLSMICSILISRFLPFLINPYYAVIKD